MNEIAVNMELIDSIPESDEETEEEVSKDENPTADGEQVLPAEFLQYSSMEVPDDVIQQPEEVYEVCANKEGDALERSIHFNARYHDALSRYVSRKDFSDMFEDINTKLATIYPGKSTIKQMISSLLCVLCVITAGVGVIFLAPWMLFLYWQEKSKERRTYNELKTYLKSKNKDANMKVKGLKWVIVRTRAIVGYGETYKIFLEKKKKLPTNAITNESI